jgi:hypothetical protein
MYSSAALTVSVSLSGDKESWIRVEAIIKYKINEMPQGFVTLLREFRPNITQTLPGVGVAIVPGILKFHGGFQ